MHACFVLLTDITFLCFPFDADQLDRKRGRIQLCFVSVGCSLKDKNARLKHSNEVQKKKNDQSPTLAERKHSRTRDITESLSVTSVYSGGNGAFAPYLNKKHCVSPRYFHVFCKKRDPSVYA